MGLPNVEWDKKATLGSKPNNFETLTHDFDISTNLFEEGKGVVTEGFLKDKNFFIATKILAKHDENYMPPEVKAALEEK